MAQTAREVLNELRWRSPSQLESAVFWYRDRTRPEGIRRILGSEVVDLERRYFTTAKGRLPFYKIERIDLGAKVVFQREERGRRAHRGEKCRRQV